MKEPVGSKGFLFTNWSKTFSCKPELFYKPSSVEEIRSILHQAKLAGKHVKIVGCGDSPSDIACTDEFMVSLENFNNVLQVDTVSCTVTVQAGISLKDLNEYLSNHGMAMQNLCAIDFVSVGGLIATGTHGTGGKYGILPTLVTELELMKADGDVILCNASQNEDIFKSALVSLGSIGVVLTVKIQCEPAFKLEEISESRSLDETLDNLETELHKSDHYKFLYYPHIDKCINIHAKRTTKAICNNVSWFWSILIHFYVYEFLLFIATYFPFLLHWINKVFHALFWRTKRAKCDVSHKVLHFDCLFSQNVTEWCIPRSETRTVLLGLKDGLAKKNIFAHFPVEVRFAKADDIYLSPCYGRDSTFINIISYRPYLRDAPKRAEYWELYERLCSTVGGRPHWAKAHKMDPLFFSKVYPKFGKFLEVRQALDPDGMFLNEYLERHLIGSRSMQI